MQVSTDLLLKRLCPDKFYWSFSYWIAGFSLGAYSAFEAVGRLAHPQYRWFVTFLVALVTWRLYWTGIMIPSRIVGVDGKAVEMPIQTGFLIIPAIAISTFLVCDVILITSGQSQIATISSPSFYSGDHELTPSWTKNTSHEERERFWKTLQSFDELTGVTTDLSLSLASLYENYIVPRFTMWITKNSASEELIVEDVQIVVHEWNDWKTPYSLVTLTSRLHTDYVDRVLVPIYKKDEPLPWTFSASHVFADPHENSALRWEGHRLTLRDNFARLLEVVPVLQDGGMYDYSARLVLRTNLSKSRIIDLFPHHRRIVALGASNEVESVIEAPPPPSIMHGK